MKKLFASICLLILVLAACQQSNQLQLTIYSPHRAVLLEGFKQRFEAANPGVAVRFLEMGSQEIYDRVKLEKANPQADIWWGASATTFEQAATEGLLEPYRPTWAAQVADYARDSQDRWYATFQTPEVIVYNREAVKPEEAPKDWDELLDAKWKERILIRDPMPSDTMRTIFGAMILRQWQNGNGPTAGYDWLRKLDANTKEYTANPTLMMQKLARQEGLISLWGLPDIAIAIYRDNFPLAFNIPASGTPVIIDGIAIVKGTRQPELARKFYEFVTTEESLLIAARDFYHPPARTNIDRAKLPEWLAKLEIKPLAYDQALYKSQIKEWMLYWDSNIRNQNNR